MLVAVADQSTKALARALLPVHQMVPLIGPWLSFRRVSYLPLSFHGSDPLAILGLIVVVPFLFLVVWRGSWSQLDVVAALGALLGGGLSNGFNRYYPGVSTHFLLAQLPWGFRIEANLAVIAFDLGAAYLLLRVLTGDLPRERLWPRRVRRRNSK